MGLRFRVVSVRIDTYVHKYNRGTKKAHKILDPRVMLTTQSASLKGLGFRA